MKIRIYIKSVIILLAISGYSYASTIDIYAHRGLRPLLPENTLVAYQAALKIGVDAVDMDINMTKDKVLVVSHDLTLNKDITQDENGKWINKSIPIKSLTLKELKKYTVGKIKPNSATAKMYPYSMPMDDIHIPTLQQVISYTEKNDPNIKYQIEIKTDPYDKKNSWSARQMAIALNKVLVKNKISSKTEVQSFEWSALIELQKLNHSVKTAYLTDHTTEPMNAEQEKKAAKYSKWVAPLNPKDFDYDYPAMVESLGGSLWEPYENDINRNDVDNAHRRGLKIVTWGWTEVEGKDFNYPQIKNLIEWRVDGIITDRPDVLRAIEAANNLELPPSINATNPRNI